MQGCFIYFFSYALEGRSDFEVQQNVVLLFVIDDLKIPVTASGLRRLSMSHSRVGLLVA